MRTLIQLSLVILTALTSALSQAEVAVVVNPANTVNLSAEDINGIFLAKIQSFPNGDQAVAINQASDAPVTSQFNQRVISKTPQQLKAYWAKLVFTGQGTPPKEVDNDAAVLKLVAENPNIIGYIDAAAVNSSVRVVGTF